MILVVQGRARRRPMEYRTRSAQERPKGTRVSPGHKIRTAISLSPELFEACAAIAQGANKSLAGFLSEIVAEWIEREAGICVHTNPINQTQSADQAA